MTAEFPHPFRLAVGSHTAGSGAGCAMNVISYENGDTEITDFPSCSASPLARLVQMVNDSICYHADLVDGLSMLCPSCSRIVLELGHATVGTGDPTMSMVRLWMRSILIDPKWGVLQHAHWTEHSVIQRIADLLGETRVVREDEWTNLVRESGGLSFASSAARKAANVQCFSSWTFQAEAALREASKYYGPAARVDYARWAIAEWHRIADTTPTTADPAATADALHRMYA